MSGMTREKLEHAVDQARQQSYAQYGLVFAIDPVQFADLMIQFGGLGIENLVDAAQPAIEVVEPMLEEIVTFDDEPAAEKASTAVAMDVEAVVAAHAHKFRMDRGGVNCLTCDLPESEGNHTD